MANNDAWRKMRKQLERQGAEVVLGKNCHYKVYRGNQLVVVMPSSSGGGRGFYNARAQLRKEGFDV